MLGSLTSHSMMLLWSLGLRRGRTEDYLLIAGIYRSGHHAVSVGRVRTYTK